MIGVVHRALIRPKSTTGGAFAPPVVVAEVILSYRKHYESDGLANYSVYEGIHEVLEQLSEAGAVLAVATLKPAKFAVHIIDDAGLSKYFSCISGITSDHSDQTKADVIREALQGIDTSASGNVVMIGDREQDALGAQETGIRFIGAGWGFGSHEEFERVSAPLICESPHQLVSIILNQG